MTRDQAVDAIMRRLAGRNDTQNTVRDHCVSEIVMVIQENLEQEAELPWFLIEQITSVVTVADQEYVDLDSAFLSFWDDGGGFWRQNSDGSETQLIIDDWDVIKAKFNASSEPAASNTAAPTHGTVIGSRLYLRAIPDDAYYLYYWQYGKDDATDISGAYADANGGNTNLWLTHAAEWVIGEAGAIVAAEIVRDPEAAANFVAQANRGKTRTMAKSILMEEQLKARFLGEI